MPDHVEHLMKIISLANKAVQEARVAIETENRGDLSFKLALIGELLFKAHTETLEAVKSINPNNSDKT